MHHCAVDGVSGAELMVNLFDLDPAGREIEPPEPVEPDPIPSDLQMVGHALASRVDAKVAMDVVTVMAPLWRTPPGL